MALWWFTPLIFLIVVAVTCFICELIWKKITECRKKSNPI